MQALRFDGKLIYDRDYPDPTPDPKEALIRVVRAGICDTDLQIVQGYMGFRGVLGHEFVGVVEKASDRSWIGRRVTAEINCSCGRCELCLGGLSTHCPKRTVLGIQGHDGAFAERIVVPERNLHPIPDDLTDDEAVFVEPLAAAFQVTQQIRLDPRTKVVVLGDGKLGNLVAQLVKQKGSNLTLIGKHPEKLMIAERMGIRSESLADVRPMQDADVVVECTGSATGLDTALSLVRPRGTIVLKTTVAGRTPINLAPLVINEVVLMGSRCGPTVPAIEALANHAVDVVPLIADIYRLRDGVVAFERAAASGVTKVLLAVDESVPSIKKIKGVSG